MKKILFLFLIGTLCFSPLLTLNVADATTTCSSVTTKTNCDTRSTECTWDKVMQECNPLKCSMHDNDGANCRLEKNCVWDGDSDADGVCSGVPYFSVLGSIKSIVNWVYAIFMIIAVMYFVLGAFKYLTAEGDTEKVKDAWRNVMYALIGVAVALLSRGLLTFVENMLVSS